MWASHEVLFAVTMPKEKTKKKQNQNRKPTKAKPPKNEKNKKQHNKQNKEGRVISWSVRDVGNLKKGDSIVSSMVSSSGLEWRSNQTKQNRHQSQKPPYTNSVRRETNTTLSGNQGSPAPPSQEPRNHTV